MATFDEFYQSLPEDSNKRGEFFEKVFIPWFLKTDPEWSTKVKQIWLWNEYPQRWGQDCGIDLVYEDGQGKHWAVQSKCVAPDREISKAEIDSFLSESNDPRIQGRLLIASTDGIGKNALQVIERQEKQVVCFLREHFRQSEVEFPSSLADLSTGRRKDKRAPRPHQEEAISNVVSGLKTADKGQLLMACGTGKTLTSLWINEALNAKRTLVLLPSLSLLAQTLREWTAASKNQFNWICVCSDKSVAQQDKTADEWIENVSELGAPVTNDPLDIGKFIQDHENGVIFSTYQSSPLIAEAQKGTNVPPFDMAFADEAHRCTGKVTEAFGCILDDQKIRSFKRLFMTATPRILSSQLKNKAQSADIDIASMDDESTFGKVLHKLSFSEAITRDLLTDYRVIVMGIDNAEVQRHISNRTISLTSTGIQTDFETLANHISLAKSIREYNLRKVITFHGRVKNAKRFSEEHPGIRSWLNHSFQTTESVLTGYVSGEMSSLERSTKINRLRNLGEEEIGILSNARCLSEGVDVPTLDAITFIDPRSSQVDIIQAVGRSIRKSNSKTYGYIILPVYLGDTEDAEEGILASRFKVAWEVILALKSQDDSLAEVLDRLRVEIGKNGYEKTIYAGIDKIIFDLPQKVEQTIGNSIRTILVRSSTENWKEVYGMLLRYAEEEGHARPPIAYPTIGKWINKQRVLFKQGQLPKERIRLLETLPGWTWDVLEYEWQESYDQLVGFSKVNGHARPPKSHAIGKWIYTQRKSYRDGILSQERVSKLEALPGWCWDPHEFKWELKYNEVVEFTKTHEGMLPTEKTHKHLHSWMVSQRQEYKNKRLSDDRIIRLQMLRNWSWEPRERNWEQLYREYLKWHELNIESESDTMLFPDSLRSWALHQRVSYRKEQLPETRIKLLEEIPGWKWDLKEIHQANWDQKFQELIIFEEAHGHASPLKSHKSLGAWVRQQRASYAAQILSPEKVTLLESIKTWKWSVHKAKWQDIYETVICFVQENKSLPSKDSNSELAKWISSQRKAFLNNTLSNDRILLLKKIPGLDWGASRDWSSYWNSQYEKILLFCRQNNGVLPATSDPDLGRWTVLQRTLYRKGQLSIERIELLEAIPGWTWDPNQTIWLDYYERLKVYSKETGHARPPQSHPGIGRWVNIQRKFYSQKRLPQDRIELLEELPGWAWRIR